MAVLRPWTTTTSSPEPPAAEPLSEPRRSRRSSEEEPRGHRCPEMIFSLFMAEEELSLKLQLRTLTCLLAPLLPTAPVLRAPPAGLEPHCRAQCSN